MAAPLILVEAQPRRASDGSTVIIRLAGGGGSLPYFYDGEHWRAGIVQLPTVITAIDFGGQNGEAGEFGAGGVPQALELEWAPSDMALFSEVSGHYWTDAPVTIYIGPETGAMPPVALSGKVLSGNTSGGVLTLAMSDPVADLKKPLLTERYGGTGDLDGPADWEGKIKRRLWGRLWNVALDPLDPAYNIFCASDPLRRIGAFLSVRDRGATAAALVPFDWQGSAIATLNALRAADAPRGGGFICPAISAVKWWTKPGDLTADLHGEVGTGYVETTAEIVERIIQAGAGLPFAPGTVAAATAARPAAVGWVADNDTTTQAAMIEELLGNSSLLWLLDGQGRIVLREWSWGAPVAAGRSYDVRRIRTLKPVGTRTIGYRRNEHVVQRSALAGIVLAEDTLFEDGSTVEELKPAEPDATKGAPPGTPVGDRPAEDVIADLDQLEIDADLAQTAAANALSAALQAQQDVIDVGADLQQLGTDLQQLGTDLTFEMNQLADDIVAAGGEISTLQTTVATQGSAITANATAISNAVGDLATLTNTVTAQGASITTNATAISGLQGSMASLTTTISASPANLNRNATFALWPDGASLPTGYRQHTSTAPSQTFAKAPGNYGNAIRVTNTLPDSGEIVGFWSWDINDPTGANTHPALSKAGPGWYLIEAEITLNSGTLASSGIALQGYDASATYVSGATEILKFDTTPDSTGAVVGNGVVGKTYHFSKLVQITQAAVESLRLVGQNYRSNFGAPAAKSITWHKLAIHPGDVSDVSVVQHAQAISTLDTQYATLSSTVTAQGSTIATQATAISGLQGNYASLSNTVATQGSTITSQATAISGLQGNYATLSSTVTAQGSTISSHATAISTLQGNVSTLQSTVSTQGSSISSLQSASTTQAGQLAQMEVKVLAGSGNLIPNPGPVSGLTGWSAIGGTMSLSVDGTYGTGPWVRLVSTVATGGNGALVPGTFPVTSNRVYSFAATTSLSNSTDCRMRLVIIWRDAGGAEVTPRTYGAFLSGPYNIGIPTSQAKRLESCIQGAQPPAGATQAELRIAFYRDGDSTVDLRVQNVKFENGPYCTPYSSEASVYQAFTALSTLNTQYANLETTVGTQGVTITAQASAITTINGNVTTLFGKAGLTVDVNGRIVGWSLNNNGQTGAMKIHADYFSIEKPGGGNRTEYADGRWRTYGGSTMLVWGAPFGSSNQFIEWAGPTQTNLANCTEANAVKYLKTNGDAYFAGSLSAGLLINRGQTTDLSATAQIVVGPFGTNGNPKTIVASYVYTRDYRANAGTGSISGSGSATIIVERDTGSGWQTIGTFTATESERLVRVDGDPAVKDVVRWQMGGSVTVTDNTGAGTMTVRARVSSRSLPSFGGTNITSDSTTQSLGAVSTE